jgi:acyl-CoA synthetase (AMP-forming)/AMP-acid ligase II
MTPEDYEALGLLAPPARVNPPGGPGDVASLLDAALPDAAGALALADPEQRFTYAELADEVARWAGAFAARGIGPGKAVAASLPNGCAIVIAFMAVQRLGAIWVGVNTVLPPKEKAFILGHSEARIYLSTDADLDAMSATLAELGCTRIDPDGESWLSETAASPPAAKTDIDPFAPAVLMYTSGTTGQPKGVCHSQHNMVTVAAALTEAGTIQPGGNRGVVQPLTIPNVMVLGAVMSFWNGKAMHTRPMPTAKALCEWLTQERLNCCIVAPTTVYDILDQNLDLPECLELAAGGAPIPTPIRNRFIARFGYPLLGTYGLTEAPTIVTDTRGVEPPMGSSGKALPHLRLAIMDKEDRELPQGEVGQLCFGPVTTGKWANVYTPPLGYWRNPEKTRELLRGGLVHSGDMGSIDKDGWLFIADRASELILRGGSNIYPAEVERVLQEHMGLVACAVVGKPDERLGKRTVAFLQLRDAKADQARIIEELQALCMDSLARYKMPDEWRFVDGFERNAMAKIVRPKLVALLEAESA